jgi:hypothetical protein
MFPAIGGAGGSNEKKVRQDAYRRQLEAQIAEKAPVPGSTTGVVGMGLGIGQGPSPVSQNSNMNANAGGGFYDRDKKNQVVVSPRGYPHTNNNVNNNVVTTEQFDRLLSEVADMKQLLYSNMLPSIQQLEHQTHTLHTQTQTHQSQVHTQTHKQEQTQKHTQQSISTLQTHIDGLYGQFQSMQAHIQRNESSRLQSELQLLSVQQQDRESVMMNLHQFKLFLSTVVGVTNSQGSAAGGAQSQKNVVNIDATGEEVHVGGGNGDDNTYGGKSLLERQGALETSMKEDMSVVKRAVADLKQRVANTQLLIAATTQDAAIAGQAQSSSSSSTSASQLYVDANAKQRVVAADMLDSMSRAVNKLSIDHDKQNRRVSDMDTHMANMQAAMNEQAAALGLQMEEMKNVLSAEITGRRKGQTKIQVRKHAVCPVSIVFISVGFGSCI